MLCAIWTKSIVGWFMSMPIAGMDYVATTAMQQAGLEPEFDPEKRLEQQGKTGPEGPVEQRGFTTNLLANLAAFLEGGGRKIDAWYATLKVVEVLFDDQPEAFSNVNTLEELSALEKSR